MAAMNIDRPLEDIMQEKRKTRQRSGVAKRGGKTATAGAGPVRNAPRSAPQVAPKAAVPALQLPAQTGSGSKIIVSNLPADVTESQIRELFQTTIGPVTRVALSYDNRGQSKGVAQVEFKRTDDAAKAFQQYNKRMIDQNRPMRIEIIVDPARIPPPPLTSRVGPVPKVAKIPAAAAVASATVAAAGGGGKRRGVRGGKKEKPKTVEELDAEMAEYRASDA